MRIAIAVWLIAAGSAVGYASEASAIGGEVAVAVRIHDYVHVDQEVLTDAQQLAAGFYAAIGVRTEWMATLPQSTSPVAAPACDGLEELTVIVLNGPMAERLGLPLNAIGSAAVAPGEMGRVAYVLYERVEDVATASAWPTTDLLAVVIAHELGHLLLPAGSHSTAGLMRGDWSVEDLRRTDGRYLAFTGSQGTVMREVLSGGRPARRQPTAD